MVNSLIMHFMQILTIETRESRISAQIGPLLISTQDLVSTISTVKLYCVYPTNLYSDWKRIVMHYLISLPCFHTTIHGYTVFLSTFVSDFTRPFKCGRVTHSRIYPVLNPVLTSYLGTSSTYVPCQTSRSCTLRTLI